MNNKIKDLLKGIGLTDSEIKVYLALLELGASSKGPIVKKSGVASSKVYELLDKLSKKGLVGSVVRLKVKYFEAAAPTRILEYVKEKEKKIEEQKEELESILPELEMKRTIAKHKSDASIYKGVKGVETAFYSLLDLLKKGEEWLVMNAPKRSEKVDRMITKFQKERGRRGIKLKIIFNEDARGDERTLRKNNKSSEIRFMPETSPASINIIKDKVMIFPSEGKDPLAIIIDNKDVATSFRVQFDKFWNQDTKILRGMKEVQKGVMENLNEIKKGQTYDVVGAAFGGKGNKAENEFKEFFKKYHRMRIKKGIKLRILFEKGHRSWVKKNRWFYETLGEIRELPYDLKSPVATFTVGNKTKMMIQKKNPSLIIIDNKDISEAYRKQFETMWKASKKMTL